MALQLRPSCEQCDIALPPESPEAMICSFECTFCRDCVETVLLGVCPGCGGDLQPRPIRPATAWRPGVSVHTVPPSTERVHRPVDPATHRRFATTVLAAAPAG